MIQHSDFLDVEISLTLFVRIYAMHASELLDFAWRELVIALEEFELTAVQNVRHSFAEVGPLCGVAVS